MQNYNTGKEPIIVREFGRNFQKMILFSRDLPQREHRQAAIERIIDFILEMYPVTNRNVEDYKIKIWSHVLQICEYRLDVDIPENVPMHKEKIKPERVPYPTGNIRYKHYGKGIERLIEKASTIEEEDRREELIRVIGAFMKMCYKNWNRDNASDDVVAQEMRILSRGRINLNESTNINYLIQPSTKVSGANSILNQQNQGKNNLGNNKNKNFNKGGGNQQGGGQFNKGGGNQQGGGYNKGNNQGGQFNQGGNQQGGNKNKPFNKGNQQGGNQQGGGYNKGNNQGGQFNQGGGYNKGNNQGGGQFNQGGGNQQGGNRNFKKRK